MVGYAGSRQVAYKLTSFIYPFVNIKKTKCIIVCCALFNLIGIYGNFRQGAEAAVKDLRFVTRFCNQLPPRQKEDAPVKPPHPTGWTSGHTSRPQFTRREMDFVEQTRTGPYFKASDD
jgi:hypothetical protein